MMTLFGCYTLITSGHMMPCFLWLNPLTCKHLIFKIGNSMPIAERNGSLWPCGILWIWKLMHALESTTSQHRIKFLIQQLHIGSQAIWLLQFWVLIQQRTFFHYQFFPILWLLLHVSINLQAVQNAISLHFIHFYTYSLNCNKYCLILYRSSFECMIWLVLTVFQDWLAC